jgi:hypothetical protein
MQLQADIMDAAPAAAAAAAAAAWGAVALVLAGLHDAEGEIKDVLEERREKQEAEKRLLEGNIDPLDVGTDGSGMVKARQLPIAVARVYIGSAVLIWLVGMFMLGWALFSNGYTLAQYSQWREGAWANAVSNAQGSSAGCGIDGEGEWNGVRYWNHTHYDVDMHMANDTVIEWVQTKVNGRKGKLRLELPGDMYGRVKLAWGLDGIAAGQVSIPPEYEPEDPNLGTAAEGTETFKVQDPASRSKQNLIGRVPDFLDVIDPKANEADSRASGGLSGSSSSGDTSFDLSQPDAQVALYRACRALEIGNDGGWLVQFRRQEPLHCAMSKFKRWVEQEGYLVLDPDMHPTDPTAWFWAGPTDMASIESQFWTVKTVQMRHFPVPPRLFAGLFWRFIMTDPSSKEPHGGLLRNKAAFSPAQAHWRKITTSDGLASGVSVGQESDRLLWMGVDVIAAFDSERTGTELLRFYAEWEELVHQLNSVAPACARGLLQTSTSWPRMNVEMEFINGTVAACVIAIMCATLAIMIFVQNTIICLVAALTIVGILASVVATLVMLKTGLGIIEALSLAIVVGLSVDYVIHLGHAYNHSVLIGRYLRSRSALDMRASSVMSAGISSIGAISVLFFCSVQVFPSFAKIFVMLIGYSLLWSLLFFTAFLMVGGPAARKRLQDSFKAAASKAAAPKAAAPKAASAK